MYRIYATASDAAGAALILAPLFLLLHRRVWKDRGQTVLYLLFAVYLSGVYAVAGLPEIRHIAFRPRLNITFFAYMFSDYRSSLLNVLLFVPLGFLLPVLWRRFRAGWRTVSFGFLASLVIETAQLFTPRATDVNDLMTNTLGTLVGFLLARLLQWALPDTIPENDSRDVYWLCGLVALVMCFLRPMIGLIF